MEIVQRFMRCNKRVVLYKSSFFVRLNSCIAALYRDMQRQLPFRKDECCSATAAFRIAKSGAVNEMRAITKVAA
ncbi:MAG TPA: hypothetical protein VNA44_13260 [Burkholderiaceae bacterium]|nr:hypothetical protein [Burkholderiaceae bacterium]